MARKIKYQMEKDEDPELDISSLVDVSFLLLIYFIITSTLKQSEADLSIIIPSNVPSEENDPIDPLSIKVQIDGSILVDDEPVEIASDPAVSSQLSALHARLEEYRSLSEQAGDKPMIIIAAEDDGKTQRFIDVVSVLAAVKITNVTMTGFRDE
jgi:biopolymer transport protein ExbD